MKLHDRLRETDDRLVPRLAERLRGLVDGTGEKRRQVKQKVAGTLLEPSPRSPLRRLDDRYASSGPLALLRDVPQLGLLVVSAVFLAGAGVALARSGEQERAKSAQQQIDASAPTALGPEVGTDINTYIASTKRRAAQVSQQSPDRVYTALVSFSAYLTPQQAVATLGELDVSKVILHAKLPSADVLPIDVVNLVPDVQKVYKDLVQRKTQEASEFTKLAASITPSSKEEEQFKAFYLAAAAQAKREIAVYRGNCPCVIGALVRGEARELAALPAVQYIRAVEVGGREVDEGLELRPLAPEQTGVVKKIVTPSGGNGA